MRITTKPTKGYSVTESNLYMNNEKGYLVGGYGKVSSTGYTTSLHISPYFANADDVSFKAIVGHELIHAYHHSILGTSYIQLNSERVAYRYTYNIFMKNGYAVDAAQTMRNALFSPSGNDYWGSFPVEYRIPSPYGFY